MLMEIRIVNENVYCSSIYVYCTVTVQCFAHVCIYIKRFMTNPFKPITMQRGSDIKRSIEQKKDQLILFLLDLFLLIKRSLTESISSVTKQFSSVLFCTGP